MKILLIGPYGIGNTILALPAMKILRKKLPKYQIDILTLLKPVCEMVKNIPDFKLFDNIYFLDLSASDIHRKSVIRNFQMLFQLLKVLRRHRYDYSVLLFPSAKIHYNILSFLIGAKKRVGAKYPDINFRRAYFLNNINIPVIEGLHDVYQNINLLSPFGIDYKKYKITKNKSVLALKNKENIIGFHPGCKKKDFYRRWDIKNYLIVIDNILAETDYKIRLFFGPDEKEEHNFFKTRLKSKRVEFISGASIIKVFDKINECKIFISNDSGLMHIANFLGCYNIAIWGPSDFRRTGPFNKPHSLIYTDIPCRPCSHTYYVSSHKFRCKYNDIRCLNTISPADVLKIILNRLK